MIKWQIASSIDKDYIIALAIEKGWKEKPPKVQVRQMPGMMENETWYVIEPYEEDCNCPGLIRPS